jgi:hypothetical protein
VVPAQFEAEFRDFYIPNERFDPKLFRRWLEVGTPDGSEVQRLATLLSERRIEVTPNLVLGEAATWGDDPTVVERLEPILRLPRLRRSGDAGGTHIRRTGRLS